MPDKSKQRLTAVEAKKRHEEQTPKRDEAKRRWLAGEFAGMTIEEVARQVDLPSSTLRHHMKKWQQEAKASAMVLNTRRLPFSNGGRLDIVLVDINIIEVTGPEWDLLTGIRNAVSAYRKEVNGGETKNR